MINIIWFPCLVLMFHKAGNQFSNTMNYSVGYNWIKNHHFSTISAGLGQYFSFFVNISTIPKWNIARRQQNEDNRVLPQNKTKQIDNGKSKFRIKKSIDFEYKWIWNVERRKSFQAASNRLGLTLGCNCPNRLWTHHNQWIDSGFSTLLNLACGVSFA